MKAFFLISLLTVSSFSTAVAQTLPIRKPGLWNLTMDLNGTPRPAGKQCIDSATDKAMLEVGNSMKSGMGMKCTKNESRKEGEKFVIETDCIMDKTHMTSEIVFEGDFESAYTSTMNTKYDPAFMGQTSMKVVTTAKYDGPCQAGQIPGDIILPNGMKVNANNIGKK